VIPNLARWEHYLESLGDRSFRRSSGRVSHVSRLLLEASGPRMFIGEQCNVTTGDRSCLAEVVGMRERGVVIMPFGDTTGIGPDSEVVGTGSLVKVPVGPEFLGRVVDPFGSPLDRHPPLQSHSLVTPRGVGRNPLSRQPIDTVFETGVRALDTFLPMGRGQRVGIFAGSGVGKSTLLGMMARNAGADINVIALIGERGREVGDFIRDSLGEDGLARSIVVVATADQSALVRELAANTASAMAEHFCAAGHDVLLIMDSVTRFAMAHREIGLATGEPPTARGYTPSSFLALPRLVERAGRFADQGSITAIYTVLVEGDDFDEPVADHMRAILDGHIVLARDLAHQGRYPAIDLLKSVSRLSSTLWSSTERDLAASALKAMSSLERYRDMIDIGAYRHGSNPEVDEAIAIAPAIDRFLRQGIRERTSRSDAFAQLGALMTNRRKST
jgi:flagellum-specific ATP synthase